MMFDNKIDVDRHVENCLKKTNSESERNLRSFAFSKLYFHVGEYELARRYVSSYLIVKPHSAEAQQLLGKIYEKLGKMEAAFEAYKMSLEFDSKQSNLVIRVCELLAKEDILMDPSKIQYWCERAQLLDPQNPVVFNLREKIFSMENSNSDDIQNLFLNELESRPTDVPLRVRLLQHLIENNRISDAYKHVVDIEKKNSFVFSSNLNWYEMVAKIFIRYRNENSDNGNLNWEFWILLISVLDKLATLSLNENSPQAKTLIECSTAIFNLDQTLSMAFENINKTCTEKQFSQEFIDHYRAQLCFHMATLVFKQAKKNQLKYKEAINLTLPLLLISYRFKPADLTCLWMDQSSDDIRKQIQKWHCEASYRCSQAGHIILALAKDKHSSILNHVKQLTSGSWREKTFKNIYITRDQQLKIKSSYFASCTQLVDVSFSLPESSELLCYDEAAQHLHPSSLHHMIWIGLYNDPVKFSCCTFKGLQYSIKNLQACAAETLNVLDIQAFLYCCTFCALSQIEDSKHVINYSREKPNVLPASITEPLGTADQKKWFSSVYKVFTNDCSSDLSDIRMTVIKGIEVIRCVGVHGLDVKLLVMLANTFAQRSKTFTKQLEIEPNEARAELYWKTALPLLEKLHMNQPINYPVKRWFEYRGKDLTPSQISIHIEEGKLFSALQLLKKKEHEKALRLLESLKNPYASYYQAQTYKCLAEEQMSHNKENLTSEMRSQHIILLSRARDCLYLTLDRLREPSVDRKHPLNAELGTEIEKIERSLSRIDPDICANRNDCEGMSDENVSSADSINEPMNLSSMYLSYSNYHNGNTTPRNDHQNISGNLYRTLDLHQSRRIEARPSPERLDAQLRQMVATKDATVSHILEQNRLMVDSHRTLVEELRSIKDAIVKVSTSVEELKSIKKTVEEVTSSVEELMSMKKVVDDLKEDDLPGLKDQIDEIKKDISELKKDATKIKSNQINEEDLYALEEDYNVDYNINTGAAGFNSAALYPNFQQRLQGTNPLAYGAPGLYGMYPMYPYGGLGLGQPNALPFPEQHLPDFRAMGSIAQGLSHTNLPQTQTALGQQTLSNMLKLPNDPSLYSKFDASVLSATAHPQFMLPPTVPPQTTLPATFNVPAQLTTQPSFTSVAPATMTVSNKPPPVNVVITASDPLPTTSVAQPVLSVIIPPQHLKGATQPTKTQPHNYQIPLPSTTSSQPSFTTVSSINTTVMPISTQNLLSNVAPPIYSSLSVKSTPQGKVGDRSLNVSRTENEADVSESSVAEEHDPCPDFKPIIPLPDEVPLTTGEENEHVMFSERAKLYRYAEKEWRERGQGIIKILHNKETNKIRILMRREQVHKICANHFLTSEIGLSPYQKSDKYFVWAANDYADESMKTETFCVKFKGAEEGKKFMDAFEQAKKMLSKFISQSSVPAVQQKSDANDSSTNNASTSLGGFKFKTTPTFKPKTTEVAEKPSLATSKVSPFASFTFESKAAEESTATTAGKFGQIENTFILKQPSKLQISGSSQKEIGGVPNVEFKPVSKLSAPSKDKNEEVLLESKVKLLRCDSVVKEWKEHGSGIMKLLKGKSIRLLMHHESTNKVCCNQQLLKDMLFSEMPNNSNVLNWCFQDHTEELKMEMYAIKFTTEEQYQKFRKAITDAQNSLDADNNVLAKFDARSQKCVSCNVPTSDEKCKRCEKPIDDSQYECGQSPQRLKPSPAPVVQTGFGDKFKPKVGTWMCKTCDVYNEGKNKLCEACETPKSESVPNKEPSKKIEQNFSFGVSSPSFGNATVTPKPATVATTTTTSAWGDQFKPNAGSWSCKACYVNNEANVSYCIACNSPKDGTVPKKDQGVDLSTNVTQKFNFGVPSTATAKLNEPIFGTKPQPTASFTFGIPKTSAPSTGFTFGISKPVDIPKTSATTTSGFNFSVPKPAEEPVKTRLPLDLAKNSFNFQLKSTVESEPKKEEFVFGSPNKHEFEFKPKSPRKLGGGDGDDSNDNMVEDDGEHIYFKPVVPLPDKIEVKTGEEDEEVLFCHRAKLFRFTSGEWKERGLGDIKILKNLQSKKIRVVMRREQVLKICLNHVLTYDIKYIPKDERTWLFHAADYSDGEITYQQFCVRFKFTDIAERFLAVVKKEQKNMSDTGETFDAKAEEEDEVKIVSETKVTAEEEQKALALQLPKNFYAYLQKEPCPGCIGCNDDDFVFQIKPKSAPQVITEKSEQKIEQRVFDNPVSNLLELSITKKPEDNQIKKPISQFHFTLNTTISSNIFASPNLTSSDSSISAAKTILAPSKLSFSATSTFPTLGNQSTPIFSTKTDSPSLLNLLTSDKSPLVSSNSSFSSSGNIFSMSTQAPVLNIFGGVKTPEVKADSKPDSKEPTKENIDSAKLFTNTQNVFGKSSVFEGPLKTDSKDEKSIFQKLSQDVEKEGNSILNFQTNLSFNALASNASDKPAFIEEGNSKPFFFAGTGVPVFGNLKSTEQKKEGKKSTEDQSKTENAGGGEETVDTDNHDPHFEPLVPLPEAIVVKTGEEDEEILFVERAKLYRYSADTKEWKERGVGNIKILYHPGKDTYRLLMRRELVHKLVLNQLITTDLNLQPLNMSERAWIWGGYNYSEDGGALENLALRFKLAEQAQQFYTAINKVREKVTAKESQSLDYKDQEDQDDQDHEQDDDYDSNESDEEKSMVFLKRCTMCYKTDDGSWKDLGMGVIKMYFEADYSMGRIIMTDDSGVQLSNTVITAHDTMQVEDANCIWEAIDYNLDPPTARVLKARFSSTQAANELYFNYQEVMIYTQQSSHTDSLPEDE